MAHYYDDPEREHCFVCKKTRLMKPGDAPPRERPSTVDTETDLQAFLATGKLKAIPSRKLTQETAKKWDYRLRQNPKNGHLEHLAAYRDEQGHLVGIKVRDLGEDGTGKAFYWVGSAKGNLYGRHLWSGGGKILTVLEGEIDTMTMSQANTHQFPVVGCPNGAPEAYKAIAKNLEWVSSFDKVVWGFDMDGPGRDACVACAKLLPPGKSFIAKWPAKDPNEVLVETGDTKALTWAVYSAEAYRPDGIIDARELTQQCLDPVLTGIPWPWEPMTKWTFGRRWEEQYLFGAGSGLGKSDYLAEIIAADLQGLTKEGRTYPPQGWGIFAYESGAATTKKTIAGKIAKRRFHIPADQQEIPWTDEELRDTMALMDGPLWEAGGKLFINESKGAADWEAVMERCRFLNRAFGIRHFLVDPIGALVVDEDEERKFLDLLSRQSANLSVELGCCMYLISHLTRPSMGPSHEEGGQVRGNQFRGSNGLLMFSNFVFGLERNQQAEDEHERCETRVRVIKDRYTGNSVGETTTLYYDRLAGTLDLPTSSIPAYEQ